MLIDHLIRLGKPFVQGGLHPADVIREISDVASPGAKGFFAHVVIVEVDVPNGQVAVEWMRWVSEQAIEGDEAQGQKRGRKKTELIVDFSKALAAPFVIPTGGNPLTAQGRYGVPIYLFYDKQVPSFRKSPEEVDKFLSSRLERTSLVPTSPDLRKQIAQALHRFFAEVDFNAKDKVNGLVVLAFVEPGGVYRYEALSHSHLSDKEVVLLSPSLLYDDRMVVADLGQIADRFWDSKIAEGAEKGRLTGATAVCAHCGTKGDVVSIYSKAWNWFTTTWEAPISILLSEERLVEGVGLCPDCYRALTYGSNVLGRLTTILPQALSREIFAPSDRPQAQKHRSLQDIPLIYGSVIVLPILDRWLEAEDERKPFVERLRTMMDPNRAKGTSQQSLHLKNITGLELVLPELDDPATYRLAILYYSGDPGRADIHLRAVIEDVLPSTVRKVIHLLDEVDEALEPVRALLFFRTSTESAETYRLLPALLVKAYGPAHIWTTLSAVLHRRPLDDVQFRHLVARRLQALTPQYTEKFGEIKREVLFYLTFRTFLSVYRSELLGEEEGVDMPSWKAMLDALAQYTAPEAKERKDPPEWADVESLGFATGYLLREFGKRFYRQTGKDYLETRVITFGNQLTPDVIYKYGLIAMRPIAARHKLSVVSLEKLLGSVLTGFLDLKDAVRKDADTFMASFWAGYSLNQPKAGSEASETENQLEEAEN